MEVQRGFLRLAYYCGLLGLQNQSERYVFKMTWKLSCRELLLVSAFFAHTFPKSQLAKKRRLHRQLIHVIIEKISSKFFVRYCWLKSRHIECIPRPVSCGGKMWSSFFPLCCIKFCCGFPDVDIFTSSEWRKRVFREILRCVIFYSVISFSLMLLARLLCVYFMLLLFSLGW